MQLDLFAPRRARPISVPENLTCATCMELDPTPIDSGLRYCWRRCTFEWPTSPACARHLASGPSWRPSRSQRTSQPGFSLLEGREAA